MQIIHINLVSKQLIPNLIPAFADPDCCGVVLVQGDNTLQDEAQRLAKLYQDHGRPVLWHCQGNSSHRLLPLQAQANQLIDWLSREHADKHWMLNATCGTKPMALAFVTAFNRYNHDHPETMTGGIPQALIIYTDSQNKEIPFLNEGIDYALPWRSVMRLEDMLAANGFVIDECIDTTNDEAVQQRAELTEYLGKQFQGACRYFLGSLQKAANDAASDQFSSLTGDLKEKPKQDHAKLLQRLATQGLIDWDGEGRQLRFANEDACRYLAGRWLEELTYLTALKCGFEQVAMSVEGTWQGKAVKQQNERGKNNEFDVLICHNNQLITIECKAKYWGDNKYPGESTNQDVVLKLESLGRKLGGLFGERLLISARELPDEMLQRAKDNQITICDRADGRAIRRTLTHYLTRFQ